eukprot:g13536.t1
MLRTIVSRTTTRRVRNKFSSQGGSRRNMGGGAMPHSEPGGNLFNRAPGADQTWASWEYGYWSTAFAGLVFGIFGLAVRPDTSIKSWAMEEAKARNGATNVKIGENYTETHGFSIKGVGEIPVWGASSGDDDEEQDDD